VELRSGPGFQLCSYSDQALTDLLKPTRLILLQLPDEPLGLGFVYHILMAILTYFVQRMWIFHCFLPIMGFTLPKVICAHYHSRSENDEGSYGRLC
jgi:hypothetical protein